MRRIPGVEGKIQLLGDAARDDACASAWSEAARPPRSRPPSRSALRSAVYTSLRPGGGAIRLFKILLDNRCRMDCRYCGLRASADTPECRLEPEELARAFIDLQRRRIVEGLFLSSAIPDHPERVQEKMIAAVAIIRKRYGFRGYVHLKILPGVSEGAVAEACRLADRVSVNLEAPNQERLSRIAPHKDLKEGMIRRLLWARRCAESRREVPAGLTTQFVVGAAGESDREILTASDWLYRNLSLRRAYYSALRPVRGTPLAGVSAPPPGREHRLYQSDWLLRFYGFAFSELPFEAATGNLRLDLDPKLAWASAHPDRFPVEINRAAREELLRVPGLGPVSAERILARRRQGKIASLDALKALRVPAHRARNYLTLDGRFFPGKEKEEPPEQLLLDL